MSINKGQKMVDAIVTGATGFLGRNLVEELLRRNFTVMAIGRNNTIGKYLEQKGAIFKQIDIMDPIALQNNICPTKYLFHSAALSAPWGKFKDFYQANVIGTKNIIEAIKQHGCEKFIHVSTPSLYFSGKEKLNITENDQFPNKFINHYAYTKYLAEMLVKKIDSKQFCTIIIRPRGIFGPYDTSILPRIINFAKTGKVPLIDNGNNLVDITYVGNVVESLILAAQASNHLHGKAYNITNGTPFKLIELLNLLFKYLHIKCQYKNIPYTLAYSYAFALEMMSIITNYSFEPKLTRYTVGVLSKSQTFNIAAAEKDLMYKPTTSIEDGIQIYAKWYNK